MKRRNKAQKKLKIYLGRLIRDVQRKMAEGASDSLLEGLRKAHIIHTQKRRQSSEKLYSWHAPEVECIGKGKAHKPYEFGCKASVMTTVNPSPGGHFVLHASALHGNPYDGHTLQPVIEQMQDLTGIKVKRVYVDKGYKGHEKIPKTQVFKSGQKRGITPTIKKELRRRSAAEPVIGHLKNSGHMGRNYLRGTLGDKQNTILAAVGYNFRQILRWFRDLLVLFIRTVLIRVSITDIRFLDAKPAF